MTLAEWITANGIRSTARRADSNLAMDDDGRYPMDHWRVTLQRPRMTAYGTRPSRAQLTVPFSMGVGHHGAAPDAETVLDCLASDAAGIENAPDFVEWCEEYGYGMESLRKADRAYRATLRQTAKLRAFLSTDAYRALLWDIERL